MSYSLISCSEIVVCSAWVETSDKIMNQFLEVFEVWESLRSNFTSMKVLGQPLPIGLREKAHVKLDSLVESNVIE